MPPVRPSPLLDERVRVALQQRITLQRRKVYDSIRQEKKRKRRVWGYRAISLLFHVLFFALFGEFILPQTIEPPVRERKTHEPIHVFFVSIPPQPKFNLPRRDEPEKSKAPEKIMTKKEPEKIVKKPPQEAPTSKPSEPQPDVAIVKEAVPQKKIQEQDVDNLFTKPAPLDSPKHLEPSTPLIVQAAELDLPPGQVLKNPSSLLLKQDDSINRGMKGSTTSLSSVSHLGTNGKSNGSNRGEFEDSQKGSTEKLGNPSPLRPPVKGGQSEIPLVDPGQKTSEAGKFKTRTLPELLNPIPPVFPPILGVKRCTVIVEMWVDVDGQPSDITCYKVEPEIDEEKRRHFIKEALEVARQYRFKPALSDGKPVGKRIRIPIRFEISQHR